MKSYFKPLNRRKFMKLGFSGGAVIATLPIWNKFLFSLPPADFYVNPECNLSDEILMKLLNISLNNGGDFSEIYIEYKVENIIKLKDNKIRSVTNGIDMGVGVRVISGEKTGYAFSDDLDHEKLKKAAEVAGLIAACNKKRKPVAFKPLSVPNYYLVKVMPDSVFPKNKAKILMKVNDIAFKYDKRVHHLETTFSDSTRKIIIANSEGLFSEDIQTLSTLKINTYAEDGDRRSKGFSFKSGRLGFEVFSEKEVEKIAKDAARMAIDSLTAEDAPAGIYPAVFSNKNCGAFFHEAIGHSLEGDRIRNKISCFWDKKGNQIASPITSIADNGTIIGKRGTINIDDEGNISQNTLLVNKGILTNFIFDHLNADLMKEKKTGNGRRESYQHYPLPRMTNTYLLPGNDDPEDIIKSVKKGIYVARVRGGNVDVTSGSFNFSVPEAYMIEDGKISRPLKEIRLIGKSKDILKNIVMIGPDLQINEGGTCGKGRQSVPVSYGNPTFKVSRINIGGSKI